MEQLTFSQVKKGNLTFKSIGTPTGVQGQTPIFSLTKDGETVKYSTDGVNYEILGGGGALIFNNVAVAVADFVTDTTYADYPYRAAIALTGVALTMIANVVFDVTDATSGNFAPLSDTYAGGTYIYAKEVPAAAITIPTIYVLSETASGGISGNAWNNRGLWVANVQYNSYDIVYDNAGCYLCVADIASTTAPESDTANWSAIYKTVAQSNPLPVGGVPNAALLKNSVNNYDTRWGLVPLLVTNTQMLNALTDGGYVDLQVVTPEDDSGYAIGHLYQFHITNDVYSWTDITPVGGAVGSKISDSLPTSGWTNDIPFWEGNFSFATGSIYNKIYNVLNSTQISTLLSLNSYNNLQITGTFGSIVNPICVYDSSNKTGQYIYVRYRYPATGIRQIFVTLYLGGTALESYQKGMVEFSNDNLESGISCYITKLYSADITSAISVQNTISNTAIKTNSLVLMSLSSSAEVRAYSKTDGSVVVEMDAVPTTAIPYTLQIIETSNEGALFVDNKYVPTAITVDQTYSSSSANAQSGKAVAQAVNGAVTVVANSFSLEASNPYVTPSFSPAASGSCYYAYRNAAGALTSTDIVNATPVECSGNGEYTFYFYRATEYTVKVANEDESESFTHTFVGTGVVKVYRLETSACPQTYIEFINM